ELAGLMVGRDVHLTTDKTHPDPGETTFSVRGLTVVDKSESVVVDDVSIDVRRGEILAIAGVDGNGQSELAEAVMGLVEPRSGTISLDGEDLAGRSVKERLRKGIGFVPEDRSTDGVIGTFTISENMILDLYDQAPYATGMSMQPAVVRSEGEKKVGEFDIRLTSIDDPISTLSGGNQQKVVLSRELGRPLRLLIASQPTRGLDVGSIEFVHKRIIAERDSGTPCVIVSTELDEVFNIADRIAVMYRGRVVGIVPAGTPRDVLGLMMAGVPEDEALARVEDGSAATEISASEEDPA
ncbi:MAG: ATP-binding cassette domain-containing protein, partial [Brevibacterium yomogidense]